MSKWQSWDDVYWHYRNKGMDLCDAAYRADQWKERQQKQEAQEMPTGTKLDGYCFRGSIAHLLGIDIDAVPIFSDTLGHDDWLEQYRKWIADIGGDILCFWFNGSWKIDDLLDWWSGNNPGRGAILQGFASTEDHAVVIRDGSVVYNTAPADRLTPMKKDGWPDGIWWFYVLTKDLTQRQESE
jgi:hypothetical protein